MRTFCVWRTFSESNTSDVQFNNYALETLLHELLLQSHHRWAGQEVRLAALVMDDAHLVIRTLQPTNG
jgi:hypothetical protein